MKRILLILGLLAGLAGVSQAQDIRYVRKVASLPATCTTNISMPVAYQGLVYNCIAGTYTATSSGGGSVSGLTATRVPVAASGTTLTDYAGFTHDGTTLTVAGLKDTALTSGRVPFATTGGLLTDSSSLTFNGGFLSNTAGGLSFDASGSGGLYFTTSGVSRWLYYSATDTEGDIRDVTNGRQHLRLIQGSTAALARTGVMSGLSIGSVPGTAYFEVINQTSSQVAGLIKLAASQSADALQVQNSSGTVLTSIASGGAMLISDTTGGYTGQLGLARESVGGDSSGFRIYSANSARLYYDGYNHIFRSYQGTTEFMRISETGLLGVGTNAPAAIVHISKSLNAAAWGTAGIVLRVVASSHTDTTSSGTVANIAANSIGIPTFAAGATTTYTAASTFYIAGPPTASTNATFTSSYALQVATGNVFVGGVIRIGSTSTGIAENAAGVLEINNGTAGTFRDLKLRDLTASGNFFAGPSTIETFTTNASALGTLNYYTDSQTIYYDTAAATGDVTLNVDASASVDLNTRLATNQAVTVVLVITNTGTAYKCNTLQIHSVGQTIKWVGGVAPVGVVNGTDFYTFTIMKTGASTYYVTGSMTTYK